MPLACVTGASSGIGREFCVQLNKMGYDLILVGRNREELEKTAGLVTTPVQILPCDLSDEEAALNLGRRLADERPDLLINNAGFGYVGPFAEADIHNDLSMIHVNVEAMQILMRAVLPYMIEQDSGYILNTASTAGLLYGGPYMASYYATKSYVVSLTTSVRGELARRKSHVAVSALCPGPVHTGFDRRAGVRKALPGITAEKCVRSCLAQMKRRKLIIVPGFFTGVGTALSGVLPRQAQSYLISLGQRRKM